MKRAIGILLGTLLVASTLFANGQEETKADGGIDTYHFTIAGTYSSSEACMKGAEIFVNLIEEKSGGKLTADLFSDAALGAEKDCYNMMAAGELDMMVAGNMVIDTFAPGYMFLTAPFMISSWDHMVKILEGDLGKKMFDQIGKNNIMPLAVNNRGVRQVTANKVIKTPSDFTGVRFRLPEIASWTAVWEGIGAQPTTITLSELYGALQTGTVHASDGPFSQIATHKLYEVQDYLMITEHTYDPIWLLMDKKLFESFSKETQDLLIECAIEGMEVQGNELAESLRQGFIDECEDGGMKLIEVNKSSFEETAIPVLKEMFNKDWTSSYEEVKSYNVD